MKYITAVAVLIALIGEQTNAVKISHDSFSEDLVKSLAEDMAKDTTAETAEAAPAEVVEAKPAAAKKAANATKKAANASKKADAKKGNATKAAAPAAAKKTKEDKEEVEIPMDQAAIKAYSSVIADAAEDSEPQTPVQYHEVMAE